ncbi:unnamed protein product [Owenia fusiformis]|uniref:Uncharacterized protein n=1 Tax=Owenia fusiformis TaxID=6347 RepID=A0A8J1UFR9_OWEFU|nr:unnamed protein product [Owenia fusiformis]
MRTSANRTYLQFYILGICTLAAQTLIYFHYFTSTNNLGHQTTSQKDTISLFHTLTMKEHFSDWNDDLDEIKATHANDPNSIENFNNIMISMSRQNMSNGDINDSIKNMTIKPFPKFKKDPFKLIYNRLPKCGSTTMLLLITLLQEKNHFIYQTSGAYHNYTFSETKEFEFVHQITTIRKPVVFDKHTYFVDFSKYGLPMPLYMNMIRDPVDQAVSMFYYNRRHSVNMQTRYTAEELNMTLEECIDQHSDDLTHCDITHDMYTLWFCGNSDECSNNRTYAMQRARMNIEKNYTFVGLTEYFDESIIMIEKVIPRFFKGAAPLYQQHKKTMMKSKRTNKIQPSEHTKVFMKFKLSDAYEIYNFAKQRFFHAKMKMNL